MKYSVVASQLAEIRKLAKIDSAGLAQTIGASLVAVSQWERGDGAPSQQQRRTIAALLSDLQAGRRPGVPSLVLQNGSFASRGSRRKDRLAGQADLFCQPNPVELAQDPLPPILSRLKSGPFFCDGQQVLASLLQDHRQPAKTLASAPGLEVSAGKNTYTYDAHTYHTKVPPQGIVELLDSYLPEGGLVLDPFAGSGMTGVAARIAGMDAILNELSPAASFISHNFTEKIDPTAVAEAMRVVLSSLDGLRASLYRTDCRECGKTTEILYTVWSYRVICPSCGGRFTLWDHCRHYGRSVREHKILKAFPCPICRASLQKRTLERTSAVPVLVGYKCCTATQQEHPLTREDLEKIAEIDSGRYLVADFYPKTVLPEGVNLNQPRRHGLDSIDRFYTVRNLSALSAIWREIHRLEDTSLASALAFAFTSLYQRVTRLSEFRFWGGSGNTARFNVPYIFNEANVFATLERKTASIVDHLETTAACYRGRKAVACGSATDLHYLPDASVDMIFTDPPFGANINYSEMNILWESWLGEFTDAAHEAIVSRVQGKRIEDYEDLMAASLAECFRVLRPGHWMLLVFMNSSKEVWAALKSAVRRSGFVTERLDIFDKQHGTFKQFVSEGTAGCDLVLHCRKPVRSDEPGRQSVPESGIGSVAELVRARTGGLPMSMFLHVGRDSEPDLRRLYSEWLSVRLLGDEAIMSFADFRDEVMRLIDNVPTTAGDDDW